MSATIHRTPRSGKQSLLFQDLASPISAQRSKFNSLGKSASGSALWRENFESSDLPPPPVFTLGDRSDISPEYGVPDYLISPETKTDLRFSGRGTGWGLQTPEKSKAEGNVPFSLLDGRQNQQSPGTSSWWSPVKPNSCEKDDKGKGSPVEGVVQPVSLIMLPPPREVARPETQRKSLITGNLDEEEWVTVYGFSLSDTNLVLREFEKYGVILRHVAGPRDANWMHILYQNRSDAQKALSRNGMTINGILIIGVKPVDPIQREALLNENFNNRGFMALPPCSSRTPEQIAFKPSNTCYVQSIGGGARQPGGIIASPTKSLVSKVMDLMFGV